MPELQDINLDQSCGLQMGMVMRRMRKRPEYQNHQFESIIWGADADGDEEDEEEEDPEEEWDSEETGTECSISDTEEDPDASSSSEQTDVKDQ